MKALVSTIDIRPQMVPSFSLICRLFRNLLPELVEEALAKPGVEEGAEVILKDLSKFRLWYYFPLGKN